MNNSLVGTNRTESKVPDTPNGRPNRPTIDNRQRICGRLNNVRSIRNFYEAEKRIAQHRPAIIKPTKH